MPAATTEGQTRQAWELHGSKQSERGRPSPGNDVRVLGPAWPEAVSSGDSNAQWLGVQSLREDRPGSDPGTAAKIKEDTSCNILRAWLAKDPR